MVINSTFVVKALPFLFKAHLDQCILSQGFDEYMNLVLDDAEEIHMKTQSRKPLGKNILDISRLCKPFSLSITLLIHNFDFIFLAGTIH